MIALVHWSRANVFDRKMLFRLKRSNENIDCHMHALTIGIVNKSTNGYIGDDSEVVHVFDHACANIAWRKCLGLARIGGMTMK